MHADRIWRHPRFGMPFSWISTEFVEQVKNVETKSWTVSLTKAGSLKYIALPGSQHSTSFCEKENQKNAITKHRYLKTWKMLGVMYQSNRSLNIPPGNPPGHLNFWKIFVQIAPSQGRKAVHRRSIPGDQMPPPPGNFSEASIMLQKLRM